MIDVTWKGPDNPGDYITLVPVEMPDDQYGNFTLTSSGRPMKLRVPVMAGPAELRYVTGQGGRVLARSPLTVVAAKVGLTAPPECVAGSTIAVTWTGPDNPDDYITLVPKELPDGQYGNYTVTSAGSPMNITVPIMSGSAEVRYVAGQGGRVLARRPIQVLAPKVSMSAPPECAAGSAVSITWTGPNYAGDYITVVAKSRPDGEYAAFTLTNTGSPLTVTAPKEPGEAEVRYMTGQGNKVLARIPIKVVR
jgi:Ca-activated chloride channel family protein